MKKKKILNLKGLDLNAALDDQNQVLADTSLEHIEHSNTDIAIIGMAGNIAGTGNLDDFNDIIRNGEECIRDIPDGRKQDIRNYLIARGLINQTDHINFARLGYLDEIDKFDYGFFSLSPKEAECMDPNQRLFLENAWHTFEHAGYGASMIKGSRTGIFLGYSNDFGISYKEYLQAMIPDNADIALSGNITSIMAGRIAYLLDLHGPAMVVDTACSSSLTALHLACKSLRNGECTMALVGGINTILLPVLAQDNNGVGTHDLHDISSSDGKTKTFDDATDGTVAAEGTAAVLLKPLSAALNDNDCIHAIIKGSACNQDGNSIGLTAPNSAAQEAVITDALIDAGVSPETISYIEAHGTGTRLGDPIEISGISRAFRKYTNKKQFCAIGTVKTNIGHMDGAAGIAGLLKVVYALKNKELPPVVNFTQPNRKITFERSPVYITDRLTPWKTDASPRRSGISSFGLSGTNCHVILEEAPEKEERRSSVTNPLIFPISAKTNESLRTYIRNYKDFFTGQKRPPTLEDIAYTMGAGRDHYNNRLAIITDDITELRSILNTLDKEGDTDLNNGTTHFYGSHRIVGAPREESGIYTLSEEEKAALTREADALITVLCNNYGDSALMKQLCSLYIKGAAIDWARLYRALDPQKMPLPVYPFEKRRCWVSPDFSAIKRRMLLPAGRSSHPLLDGCLVNTSDKIVYATLFNVERHWVLHEHMINNTYIVPGTTYIEMVRQICRELYAQPDMTVTITGLMFSTPLIVAEHEDVMVHVNMDKKEDGLHFTIISKKEGPGDVWITHAEGHAAGGYEAPPEDYDVMGLKHIINQPIMFTLDENTSRGLELGERWNGCFNGGFCNEERDQFLVMLELPEAYNTDLVHYLIHPALLDNAVNGANHFVDKNTLHLPFHYKSLTIYKDLPPAFYSHIRKKPGNSAETTAFDITILDEKGALIIDITDYTIKKVGHDHVPAEQSPEQTFYGIEWRSCPTVLNPATTNPGTILFIKGNSPREEEIVQQLTAKGYTVIEVTQGNAYTRVHDTAYTIPFTEASYTAFIKELGIHELDHVIYAAGLDEEEPISTVSHLAHVQATRTGGLFFLCKALLKQRIKVTKDLILITAYAYRVTGDEKRIYPHNAPLTGMGKVIRNEYEHLKCRAVDLDEATPLSTVIDLIETDDTDYFTAFRNDCRYHEVLCEQSLKAADASDSYVKEDGVYLITGGTGGLGLSISNHISRSKKIHLMLTGTKVLPEVQTWGQVIAEGTDKKLCGTLKALQALEQNGSTVRYFAADVADFDAMTEVFATIKKDYGRIDGIIHAAGIGGDGFIINKSYSEFQRVLQPKVAGTWIVHELSKDETLDFFIMFSSITSLLAYPGQSDYTAANAYLDAFCDYRKMQGKKALTIQWPAWIETGMAANFNAVDYDEVFKPLLTRDALRCFDTLAPYANLRSIPAQLQYAALSTNKAQLLFSVTSEIDAAITNVQRMASTPRQTDESTASPVILTGKDHFTEIETTIGTIWAKTLGLPVIDVHEGFHNLGGNSILATRMLKEYDIQFPGKVEIADIFTYTTIQEIAEYITGEPVSDPGTQPAPTAANDDDLDMILQQLSDGTIDTAEAEKLLS